MRPAPPRSPMMSSVRGSAALPCTVTSRYVAFSFDLHCAVSNPGTLTQGVLMGRSGVTQGFGGVVPTIVRPSVERSACKTPLPPLSAAGFVQAATKLVSLTLPKRVLDGGGTVERKET